MQLDDRAPACAVHAPVAAPISGRWGGYFRRLARCRRDIVGGHIQSLWPRSRVASRRGFLVWWTRSRALGDVAFGFGARRLPNAVVSDSHAESTVADLCEDGAFSSFA